MLNSLLASLYQRISQDTLPLDAITIGYNGVRCYVHIEDDILTTSVDDGNGSSGADQRIELRSYSMQALVDYINTLPGYSATVAPSFSIALALAGIPLAQIGAWALNDTTQQVVNPDGHAVFTISQAAVYHLFKPIAALFNDARKRIDQLSTQAQVDRAASVWLSDFGDLYGIERNVNELDADYRNRIILELIAPRANNVAIRKIVRDQWHFADVTVDDDVTPATPADTTRAAQGLPFNRLNPYHFLVGLTLGPTQGFTGSFTDLRKIVTKIKPWGTSWGPEIKSLNEETNPAAVDDYRADTFISPDEAIDPVFEELLTKRIYLTEEVMVRNQYNWILTRRPIKHTYGPQGVYGGQPYGTNLYGVGGSGVPYGQWVYTTDTYGNPFNPVNDGSVTRGFRGPLTTSGARPLSIFLGGRGDTVPWVQGITEEWLQYFFFVTDETIADEFNSEIVDERGDETFIHEEQRPPSVEEWVPDTRTHLLDEPVLARAKGLVFKDYFSRLRSRFAFIRAVPSGDTLVSDVYEDFEDFRNGVPMNTAWTPQ